MSLPLIASGMTGSRRRLTVSMVSGFEGAVVAIAVKTATVPFLSTVAGDTDLIPGSFLIASSRSVRRVSVAGDSASFFCCSSCCVCEAVCCWTCCSAWASGTPWAISCCSCAALCWFSWSCLFLTWFTCFWSALAGEPSSTPIRSGPFDPGPKPFDIRSNACRAVVLFGSSPLSVAPSSRSRTGIESTIRMPTLATTERAQQRGQQRYRRGDRDQHCDCGAVAHVPDERNARGHQRNERDHDGDPGEDDRGAGGRRGARNRLTHVHAVLQVQLVAGDDEERVVDPDAQPDHRGERGGDARHVDDVSEQLDHRQRRDQPEHRGRDRQDHRGDGAEREHEDHDGGAE